MKAIILAGGLGTRLGELTKHTPKPLLKIKDEPMINAVVSFLTRHGISEIGVITHEAMLPFFAEWVTEHGGSLGAPIQLFVEKERAGTFGCLRVAREWLGDDPFAVANGDCLLDFDATEVIQQHHTRKPLITMALAQSIRAGRFAVPETHDGMVTALELQVLPPLSGLVSNGFQIVDPAIFSYDTNPNEVVSMEEAILRAIQGNSGVLAVPLEAGRFIDCGTPESLIFATESWYS